MLVVLPAAESGNSWTLDLNCKGVQFSTPSHYATQVTNWPEISCSAAALGRMLRPSQGAAVPAPRWCRHSTFLPAPKLPLPTMLQQLPQP